MKHSVGTIIDLNRAAVSQLVYSRNRTACGMFHHGLRVMHEIIQNRQAIQALPKTRVSCKLITVHAVELSGSQTDMIYSPDNFFRIYENAFLVPQSAKTYMHPYAFEDHIAAVLMYNTGLLCHRQALEIGNSKMLERALFMYEMAVSTLQQNASYRNNNNISGLFMLALASNMGHIHSHMFHHEEARSCRTLLENLINDEIEQSDGGVEDCHFFLESLQFKEFGLTLAPAA